MGGGGGASSRVHLFPLRHHSPRSSFVLRAALERIRPSLILVEGPEDASPLIDVLVDPETAPPVAILGYRTDGTPGSALWPFASYSPEYVALHWAKENGVEARFIDVATGQALAPENAGEGGPEGEGEDEHAAEHEHAEEHEEAHAPEEAPAPEEGHAPEEVRVSAGDRAAVARGFRSFEEFWEASFEAPDYQEAAFREALVAYADLIRAESSRLRDRARDAFMARRIDEAVAAGTPPERIVAVLGAAHAAALAVSDVDPTLIATLPAALPSTTTIIPYSFPRLAEQTGYGAGNRAPQFYQRAWDARLSFRRAALEVLIDFCDHLRVRGFAASLADTIEAYRLSTMLAAIRGKAEPGLDEIREATIATMCRGESAHVDSFLWPSVIGRNVGKVASRIGRNSLQEEFWREVEDRRLPRTDAPEDFVLKLGDPVQVETSVFLHRLRVADIPYASFMGTQSAGMRASAPAGEEAGGFSALSRVKEAWQGQWTPATDVALVERIVLGETLQQVCQRVLSQRLGEARTTAEAAGVLLESVVASTPETMSTALAACDRLAAADDDLASLARACRALSGLVSYGSSRASAKLGAGAIAPLCRKTFERAILRVPIACVGNDEAVTPAKEALRVLAEIGVSQPLVDKAAWFAAARALVVDYAANAGCCGVACGLLYLAQEMGDEEIQLTVAQRLSDALEPERAAGFLAGFMEVNALVLVKSRTIVKALDDFLNGIDKERFRDLLPVLRRGLGTLGPTERRYLLENLVALRGLGGQAKEAAAVIAERDKEKLAAMSDDIAKALDDLDDLL